MHNPELFALGTINWQVFCTFTFARTRIPVAVKATMFFSLLREIADNSGVHFKSLIWCLRSELGDQTGRHHFHAVIAGIPRHRVCKSLCFYIEDLWRKQRGGHAKVTEYISSLDGLDYILKPVGVSGPLASRYAGDYHELTKFGGSCDVTLSESVLRVLQGRRRYRRDTTSSTLQSGVSEADSLSAHCVGR